MKKFYVEGKKEILADSDITQNSKNFFLNKKRKNKNLYFEYLQNINNKYKNNSKININNKINNTNKDKFNDEKYIQANNLLQNYNRYKDKSLSTYEIFNFDEEIDFNKKNKLQNIIIKEEKNFIKYKKVNEALFNH